MLDKDQFKTISEQLKGSEKRLLFFDYDGTLMPLVKVPSLSSPNEDVIRVISRLTSDNRNKVVIISGRDSATIGRWFGSMNLIIVAEHGALIKYPGERWESLADEDIEWKKNILPIMEIFSNKCPGAFTEEKKYTVAWHYRNAPAEMGNYHSRELIRILMGIVHNSALQVLDGNKIVEVRFTNIHKGVIAKKIVKEVCPDFIMAIGDDRTDEDMFKALGSKSVSIKIGPGETAATYSLPVQEDVPKLLKTLFLNTKN